MGAHPINFNALQETYPHLAVLDPVANRCENIEMILGWDVYYAIRPLKYFAAHKKCSSIAVRLTKGTILCGPLPSSSCFSHDLFQSYYRAEF